MIRIFERPGSLIQLEHADILNLRITPEVIFLNAGIDTVPVSLAFGNIDRVTENDTIDGWRIRTSDIDAGLSPDFPCWRASGESV